MANATGGVVSKKSPEICARIGRWLDHVSNACVFVCSCAMVVLLVIFGWLVFGRYVLNATPTWVEQLALLLVCYIAFVGSAAGVRENSHLGVEFIRESFAAPVRRVLRLVTDVAMAGFGLVMFLTCVELVEFGWSTNLPMLNIPEGIRTLSAAVCGGLIFVFATARTVARVHRYYIAAPDGEPGKAD